MRITLHQLNVFMSVAKHRSVTLAAHQLHMTQPAVSNIIKQLEDYYGCALIEVIGRKLSLTAFGKAVVESSRSIQQILTNTQAEIELLKGGLAGTLKVATVSTAKYFVPHLLGIFKKEHTNIHVKLTVTNRQNILQRLKENDDDFVIMSHPPTTPAVDCAEFYDDELVVAASTQYLQNTLPTQLANLKNEPWIIREEGSGTRYATERLFKQYKFTPTVEMEISDNEAIKQALIANMGVSVLSKQSIKLELENNLLQCLPIRGFPVTHQWYLVKNKGKALPPIAENFYTFVNKHQPIFTNVY